METSSSLTRSESKDTQGTCILHQQTRGIDSCRGEPEEDRKKVEVTVADKSFRLYTVVVDFWRTIGRNRCPCNGPVSVLVRDDDVPIPCLLVPSHPRPSAHAAAVMLADSNDEVPLPQVIYLLRC
jgi:hypothetical protein